VDCDLCKDLDQQEHHLRVDEYYWTRTGQVFKAMPVLSVRSTILNRQLYCCFSVALERVGFLLME
jgi:hypothetical protein